MVDKLYLVLNEPIRFDEVCTIYQPTLEHILKYGQNNFNRLLLPYTVSVNMLENSTEVENAGVRSYDLLFQSNKEGEFLFAIDGVSFLDLLIISLQFFCRESVEYDFEQKGFKIGENKEVLNRDNFDRFADTILEICNKERPMREEIPEFKSERQKAVWLKIQEGRKKRAKDDELKLENIVLAVMFGSRGFISANEIKQWSIWQLITIYKTILEIEQYSSNFRIALTGFAKDIDLKHWTQRIKL